jgi:malonyl CoA-acyl carrier protein transacylase
LFTEWPADAAPLGAVLVFASAEDRDAASEALRRAGVYCPVHWADAADSRSERVRELAVRILTIPTDWRYSAADMARVASLAREAVRAG